MNCYICYKYTSVYFFYLDRIIAETEKYAQPQSTGSSSNNSFTDQNKEISRDSKIPSELFYHVAFVYMLYACMLYI